MATSHAPVEPVAVRAEPAMPSPGREPESTQELQWKLRIAVLWIFLAASMSAHTVLMMMTPGVIAGVTSGKLPDGSDITASATIMFALFWLVPCTMAFLTLTLSKTINRSVNVVLGLLASGLWSLDVFEHVSLDGSSLMVLATIVSGLLIVWHAWKWPRPRRAAPTQSN